MRRRCLPLIAALALLAAPVAQADILIRVDKAAQIMTVDVDGAQLYVWPVSTGIAPSYDTPAGEFKPFRMERTHFSREWDDAPMPNSIFFTQDGHAIHGSGHVKNLGRPASHGCVRLAPENAATLFNLIRQHKMANTRVVLTGEAPASNPAVARRPRDDDDTMRIYNNEEDFTNALPSRKKRTARNGDDGGRSTYYREPYYREPYYREPYYPRRDGSPFPFPFGR